MGFIIGSYKRKFLTSIVRNYNYELVLFFIYYYFI